MPEELHEIGWFESKLPPYGLLPTLATVGDTAPADWRASEGPFVPWRADALTLFNRILWPRCNAVERRWEGLSVGNMSELTVADLALLQQIRAPGPDRLIDTLPVPDLRHLSCPPHRSFFEGEDGDASKKLDSHRLYNREADRELLVESIPALFVRGLSRKCSIEMIFWFKHQMQRPRAYQAGLLYGMAFSHEGAKTALHPSIISGHCMQGMCGLMGVAEQIELDKFPFKAGTWEGIYQFCADFGDRRVMAGVHYPSDNLASWILALDLCERVVAPTVKREVKTHLWRAITERSLIYKLIVGQTPERKRPYELALGELRKRAPQ